MSLQHDETSRRRFCADFGTVDSADAAFSSPSATAAGLHADEPAQRPTVFHEPASRAGASGRRAALVAALACLFLLLVVVVAGRALEDAAVATDFDARNLAPSLDHPAGTDWMGRDMLARTLAGLSTSILVGLLAAAASAFIALVLASVAALGGSGADTVVNWLIEVVTGIPHLVLLILIGYALGRGAAGVMVGISITHWPSLTRVLRAEIMQVCAQPYIACSQALGVSRVRMVLVHMLPHVLPQLLVGLILLFPHAVLHEASITFLGFGLSPEQPAIGVILSEAMGYLTSGAWWLAVVPGAALLGVVLLFNRVGALVRRLV